MTNLPLWSTINRFYFDNERIITINGSPKCHVRFEKEPNQMTFIIEQKSDIDNSLTKLENIKVYNSENPVGIAVRCSEEGLFEFFYMAAGSILRDVQEESTSALTAITKALKKLECLVARKHELDFKSIATGLWGELYILKYFIESFGTVAVQSWFGPDNEVHDFRMGDIEVEVKTTRNEKRRHVINSFTQLQPSEGKSLYICSVTISPNSSGNSLIVLKKEIESIVKKDTTSARRFYELIADFDFVFKSEYSSIKYDLRFPTLVYQVGQFFPKITRELLDSTLSGDSSSIVDGSYTIEIASNQPSISLDEFVNQIKL